MTFTDLDRLSIGGVKPTGSAVGLKNRKETGDDFFLQPRELGVLNIGGLGTVRVDGKAHELANLDSLYVAMGSREVTFESAEKSKPAKLVMLSAPAHHAYETTVV